MEDVLAVRDGDESSRLSNARVSVVSASSSKELVLRWVGTEECSSVFRFPDQRSGWLRPHAASSHSLKGAWLRSPMERSVFKAGEERGHPRPEQKQLSQESAVGVRWLFVLSVCLLALDHCESTTFAIFQRLQPRNQPKTLDSAQDLPSNQQMSRKDLSAGNCRALKNPCSVQSITRVDWDTTCLPRHAVGQNNCLHS